MPHRRAPPCGAGTVPAWMNRTCHRCGMSAPAGDVPRSGTVAFCNVKISMKESVVSNVTHS